MQRYRLNAAAMPYSGFIQNFEKGLTKVVHVIKYIRYMIHKNCTGVIGLRARSLKAGAKPWCGEGRYCHRFVSANQSYKNQFSLVL